MPALFAGAVARSATVAALEDIKGHDIVVLDVRLPRTLRVGLEAFRY